MSMDASFLNTNECTAHHHLPWVGLRVSLLFSGCLTQHPTVDNPVDIPKTFEAHSI